MFLFGQTILFLLLFCVREIVDLPPASCLKRNNFKFQCNITVQNPILPCLFIRLQWFKMLQFPEVSRNEIFWTVFLRLANNTFSVEMFSRLGLGEYFDSQQWNYTIQSFGTRPLPFIKKLLTSCYNQWEFLTNFWRKSYSFINLKLVNLIPIIITKEVLENYYV